MLSWVITLDNLIAQSYDRSGSDSAVHMQTNKVLLSAYSGHMSAVQRLPSFVHWLLTERLRPIAVFHSLSIGMKIQINK
jgi:hypothetical protein